MNCRHCGTGNDEEDHRCTRCGRRLHFANARPAPDNYAITTATAPALYAVPQSRVVVEERQEPPTAEPRRSSIQPSLFPTRESLQVIPFESYAPDRTVRKRSTPQQPRNTQPRVENPDQQSSLEFYAAAETTQKPQARRTSAEAVIYCDAPVATPTHRCLASAIDLVFVFLGVGMFLLTYSFLGGTFPQAKNTIPIFGAFGGLVYLLYEALWTVSGADTPGIRFSGLQLIDFDGREPELRQRVYRLLGSLLSLAAAGIGLIWAVADEEKLTWHDHMSNTFPTYKDSQRG